MSNIVNIAQNKVASQSSVNTGTFPNDASGLVSGHKTGGISFHTNTEFQPWWQVDLGRAYTPRSIVIYNCDVLGSPLAEQAKEMQVLISIDGKNWSIAYSGGCSFGGVIDGHPLVLQLTNVNVRFVRLQLPSVGVLHLDQIEILSESSDSDNRRIGPALGRSDESSLRGGDVEEKMDLPLYDQISEIVSKRRERIQKILLLGTESLKYLDSFNKLGIEADIYIFGAERYNDIDNKYMPTARIKVHYCKRLTRANLSFLKNFFIEGAIDFIVDCRDKDDRVGNLPLFILFPLIRPGGKYLKEETSHELENYGSINLNHGEHIRSVIQALSVCDCDGNLVANAEKNYLNESVIAVCQNKFKNTVITSCIERYKFTKQRSVTGAIAADSVLLINYASNDKLNSERQICHSKWYKDWLSEYIEVGPKNAFKSSVLCFTPDDLDDDFANRNKKILKENRGGGYWLWKPYIIATALEATSAEFVIYCDSGTNAKISLSQLIQTMRESAASIGVIEMRSEARLEHQWTKGQLFRAMNAATDEYLYSHQIASGFSIWRNDLVSRQIVGLWLEWIQRPWSVNDSPSEDGLGEFIGFREHRHDQSILSLLLKKLKSTEKGLNSSVYCFDFDSTVAHHAITVKSLKTQT